MTIPVSHFQRRQLGPADRRHGPARQPVRHEDPQQRARERDQRPDQGGPQARFPPDPETVVPRVGARPDGFRAGVGDPPPPPLPEQNVPGRRCFDLWNRTGPIDLPALGDRDHIAHQRVGRRQHAFRCDRDQAPCCEAKLAATIPLEIAEPDAFAGAHPERLPSDDADLIRLARRNDRLGRRRAVELPEPHRAIGPARDDPVALRRERDAQDITLMALEGRGRGRAVEPPEPHRAIRPARDDPVALRRECDAIDRTLMALEGRGRGRAVELPEPHRAILPARDDPVALRRECDARDITLMALEGRGRGRAVELPEPHRAIGPARDDPVALRRERDARDPNPHGP